MKRECKSYIAFMKTLSEEKTLSLARRKEEEAENKKHLLSVAHARHKAQLETLRKDMKSRMAEDDRRKRMVFEDLQEQVLAERRRKVEAQLQKEADDKRFAEESEKKIAEEMARESAVKAEMERFYRNLAEEAEKREARAKWKLRRLELRGARIKFWREENKKMNEMRKNVAKNQENERRSTMKVERRRKNVLQ